MVGQLGVLHGGTAVVFFVNVQAVSALKVATRALAVLLAFKRTPVKVCVVAELVLPTATVVTVLVVCKAAPLSTKLPELGFSVKVTVTSPMK